MHIPVCKRPFRFLVSLLLPLLYFKKYSVKITSKLKQFLHGSVSTIIVEDCFTIGQEHFLLALTA